MIRHACFAVPFILAGVAVTACEVTTTNAPSNGSVVDGGSSTTTDSGDAGTSATLPFVPSNLKLDGIDASKLGDFVADSATCEIDTESKLVGCGDMDALGFVVVDQPGAGKIGVYVAKSFRVEPNASLKAKGTYALAIVALADFDIEGGVDVSAGTSYPSSGGFKGSNDYNVKGAGQGAGGAGSTTNGAGGAGYCGIGGTGASVNGGTAGSGGGSYGTPENIPLIGGSSGGNGTVPEGGTGGGAIQLVAGRSLTIGVNGWVSAGGGGGGFVGAVGSQHGSGGGSGGAILVEADTVTLLGTLAANGGAGGSKEYGQDGHPSADQAMSVAQTNGSLGGTGSAATDANGGNATFVVGDSGPGGGGAAGRIRVNSTSGNSSLTAKILSPTSNGPCMTEGTLKR